MIRKLVCLLPWMALATVAYGQVRPADVLYTHYDDAPTRGFRLGDEVFVPIDQLGRWDWAVTTKAELAFVKAEGVEFMVPTRTFNGRLSIPMVAAVKKAGGVASWDRAKDTLNIYAELASIRVDAKSIKFYAGFKTTPRVSILEDPKRVVVDLPGASIGPKTQQFLGPNVRLAQPKENLVRIIVETENIPDVEQITRGATHSFELELPEPKPKIEIKIPDTPPVIEPPVTDENIVEKPKSGPILPLRIDKEHEKGLALSIPLAMAMSGPAQARRPEPEILEITLPGIAMLLPEGFKLDSASVKDVTRNYNGTGTVVRFEFTRPMAAEMWTEGTTVRVNLTKPSIGGTLAGKVIVVDPGHGGHDGGAKAGNVREKDLNLKIGKLIAQKLTEQGATVIMTRKTDVFISLNNRSKLANDSDADLFISSHINSTGKPAAQSGTITFHHKNNGIGKLLAECIHREIVKVNKLPNKGVWSDGRIYDSGFAVLRQTTMPGVLLELGFINHPTDRKRMITQEFQDSVAAAVVRGIKVFLGDGQ